MKRGPDPTSERIYRVVKQQVLDGVFRPGERIEAAQLADLHNASITPVRAALHRLVGEQLVDARPSEGFHAPQVSEPSLRDLYDWNGQVLQIALQLSSPQSTRPDATAIPIGEGQDDGRQVRDHLSPSVLTTFRRATAQVDPTGVAVSECVSGPVTPSPDRPFALA